MEAYHRCTKCQELVSADLFKIRANAKRHNICRKCQNKYFRERYRQNKQYFKNLNQNNRIHLTTEINKLKDFPCVDCGIKYEPFCMEFDHIKGDKWDAVAKMVHNTYSLARIKKEIAKTELVCILCHKTRTYNRLQRNIRENLPAQQRNRFYVESIKKSPCHQCNKIYNHWQMEFHHLPGFTKRKPISVMVVSCYSIKAIQQEIEKCHLLCSLCHRMETAKSW